jgi:HK97 family phage major capsid protein
MPAIAANAYPILFGDLRGYYIVDRVGLSVEVLREIRALRGEVVVYARKRVGGQLVHDWRLKDMKLAAS